MPLPLITQKKTPEPSLPLSWPRGNKKGTIKEKISGYRVEVNPLGNIRKLPSKA